MVVLGICRYIRMELFTGEDFTKLIIYELKKIKIIKLIVDKIMFILYNVYRIINKGVD